MKHKRKWKAWKWVLIVFLLLLLAGVGYYTYALVNFGMGIQQPKPDEPIDDQEGAAENDPDSQDNEQGNKDPIQWKGAERVNILLLGVDDRGFSETNYGRSDTMLVLSIDTVRKKAHLLSILRDAYVEIPGYYKTRVNAALPLGGPELAMETIGKILNLPIHDYVYVDFKGFVELIDAIGGVEYEVERDMYYTSEADGPEYDINLKAGLQTLDGSKALQYVRFRNDAKGDYGRAERQRNLLTAVANEMQSTMNFLKLPSILSKIQPYIETSMTLSEMVQLGNLGFQIRHETIENVQIPPSDLLSEETIGGAWMLTFDQARLHDFVDQLFEDDVAQYSPDLDETEQRNGEKSG